MKTRTGSAILLLLLGLVGLGSAPASATSSETSCDPSTDVVVTVDASTVGGEYTSLCVAGQGGDIAAAVLGATGIPIEQGSGEPGTICRIDNLPEAAQAGCDPSTSAASTWTLFTAPVGGAWTAQDDNAQHEVAAGEFATFLPVPAGESPTPPDQVTTAEVFASTALVPADVTEGASPATASPDDTSDEASSSDGDEAGAPTAWLIVALVVGVAIVVGLGVLVLRRRDRQA